MPAYSFSIFGIVVVALSLLLTLQSPAHAQSSQCRQLQNRLSILSSGGGQRATRPSAQFKRYDAAVRKQRSQLSKTRRMAQRNRCNNKLVRRNNCQRILGAINKMNSNLRQLERKRAKLAPRKSGGNNSSKRERRAVIRAMNRRGCFDNNANQRVATAQPQKRNIFEKVFGKNRKKNGKREEQGTRDINAANLRNFNTFRTMCVRLSDGYYFPISFSTTPNHFANDERSCMNKCPGSEVALYYHAMPSQNSEEMISYRGKKPYAKLPSAFSYRQKFEAKAQASCQISANNLQEVGGANGERATEEKAKEKVIRIGTPKYRKDRAYDPETLANQEGSFGEQQILSRLTTPEVDGSSAVASNSRKIRIVGPAFYPVQ